MCFSQFLLNKILFLGAGNSVVLQVENFNDGWMRSFDSGSDEAALPGFFYDCSQQAFGDSPLSVSAVHPALWDKRRYGSLRGSSKGHYRRRRTPSSWGHKARWNRKRENARVLVSLCQNGWGFGSETVQKGALRSFRHLRAEALMEDKWVFMRVPVFLPPKPIPCIRTDVSVSPA